MSQIYEIRKAKFEGKDDCSVRVIIPSKFVEGLKITKGDYLKFFQKENQNQLIVERLDVQGGQK